MNRKNTILIAVLVNAGLLAVLFITAMTGGEDPISVNPSVAEAPVLLPAFDEKQSLFEEVPIAVLPETPAAETAEPLVHKLPPMNPVPVQESAPVAVSAPISQVAGAPSTSEVVVKKGDSLEKIAKAHHTTVNELIKLNRLPSTFLKIGQVVKIPVERSLAAAPKPAEKKAVEVAGPEYYTMKVGENPWAIAVKHHMKLDELLKLNGLNEEKARKLKAGDRLRIR